MTGAACIGGPISDWPRGDRTTSESDDRGTPARDSSKDDDEDFGGNDDADEAESDNDGHAPPNSSGDKDPTTGGARRDGGTGTGVLDAGTPDSEGEDNSDGDSGDAGVSDGGVNDAEIDTPEGPDCTMTSDARSADSCYGSYCRTPLDDFMSMPETGGACASADELELACDGEIARVVAECAQQEALSLGLGRSVASCARRVESLASVGRGCLDCYVDEIVCAVRNCLVSCLDGSSSLCSECRSEQCGDAFLSCSGLPKPRGVSATTGGPTGVDGGLPRLF